MLSLIQINISKATISTEEGLCVFFERERKVSSLAIKVVLIFQFRLFFCCAIHQILNCK